jgi:trk system potassium uptake protein TrkA
MVHSALDPVFSFGSGEASLFAVEAPHHWIGHRVKEVTIAGEILAVAIARNGKAFIPAGGSEFRAGDILHLAVLASSMERLEELLGGGEGG